MIPEVFLPKSLSGSLYHQPFLISLQVWKIHDNMWASCLWDLSVVWFESTATQKVQKCGSLSEASSSYMSHLTTKPTKWHVHPANTQISLASVQSDQSLHCLNEESLGPELPIECTTKTLIRLGGCPGWTDLRWAHSHFVGFVMRRLI